MSDRDAVIVAYGRSAYGKARKGALAQTHPVEYAAQVLRGVLDKLPQLRAEEIDDFFCGCALPHGVSGYNIGKVILQRAQLPDTIPAVTLNRFCSSGMQAISAASNAIRCGEIDVAVAGGVESMSLVSGDATEDMMDPWLRQNRPGVYTPMGLTAENVAEKYDISREEMDAIALESHRKAARAQAEGRFADQIIPVEVVGQDGATILFDRDEGIRPDTSMEKLAQLKPCFREGGTVTAGNSSQVTDGAGFVVLMSREKACALGIRPIARLVAFSARGVPAEIMGIGPVEAIPRVMKVSGLSLEDMDVIELNEAFASQTAACIRELGLDRDKVNPMGGAIALGHPLGASAAMLVCKALSWLKQTGGRYGLVSMCVGGGQGAAGIFEMI